MALTLTPMTEDEYAGWVDGSIADYARDRAESGADPAADALRLAEEQFAELLPAGLATPGHELFVLRDGSERVGMIWIHTRHESDGDHVFGYDFEVREDLRRQGYGRAAMVAVEELCRARGVVALELSVFGPNVGARVLYEQMGFEPVTIRMRKRL